MFCLSLMSSQVTIAYMLQGFITATWLHTNLILNSYWSQLTLKMLPLMLDFSEESLPIGEEASCLCPKAVGQTDYPIISFLAACYWVEYWGMSLETRKTWPNQETPNFTRSYLLLVLHKLSPTLYHNLKVLDCFWWTLLIHHLKSNVYFTPITTYNHTHFLP